MNVSTRSTNSVSTPWSLQGSRPSADSRIHLRSDRLEIAALNRAPAAFPSLGAARLSLLLSTRNGVACHCGSPPLPFGAEQMKEPGLSGRGMISASLGLSAIRSMIPFRRISQLTPGKIR